MTKVLVVDDSALARKLLIGIFAAEGDFEVASARNGHEALEMARSFAPDVITLDIRMPDMDGLAFLDRLMVENPRPVVMVSSLTAAGAAATLEAMRLGAVDFVAKPSGAISLDINRMAPLLVGKVRAASRARIQNSLRLVERVRQRIGNLRPVAAPGVQRPTTAHVPAVRHAAGAGLGLVLIGTSTGGPPALEMVLGGLPGDLPWPVLVAQHMPASFTGALARRLAGLCALDVVEVARPTPLLAGRIYIARGDADMVVSRRPGGLVVVAAPGLPDYPWHPSVERMVTSAMEHIDARRLVGVLMTGMGRDGVDAMTRLRAAGGRTIAESEATAVVWGMPGELVRAGGAEVVVDVNEIANRLNEMVV